MRKIRSFILALVITFLGSIVIFFLGLFTPEVKTYPRKSYATQIPIEQKEINVVIKPGFSGKISDQTVVSVLSQKYSNFNVFFVGEISKENCERINKFIAICNKESICSFPSKLEKINEERAIYRTLHSKSNRTVSFIVDGDDVLCTNQVLKYINSHFADPTIWALSCVEINRSNFEQINQEHLPNVFYTGLFKNLSLENYHNSGRFDHKIPVNTFKRSLKELAGSHLYIASFPLMVTIKKTEDKAKNEKDRIALKQMNIHPALEIQKDNPSLDIVVLSHNSPLKLYAFLESARKNINNYNQIHVLYNAANDHYVKGYKMVSSCFANISIHRQDSAVLGKLSEHLLNQDSSQTSYVLITSDNHLFGNQVNFSEVIETLHQTRIPAWIYRSELININSQGKMSPDTWVFKDKSLVAEPYRLDSSKLQMGLYKKKDIHKAFKNIKLKELESVLTLITERVCGRGLCLKNECLNIPCFDECQMLVDGDFRKMQTIDAKQQLMFFNQGLKAKIQQKAYGQEDQYIINLIQR